MLLCLCSDGSVLDKSEACDSNYSQKQKEAQVLTRSVGKEAYKWQLKEVILLKVCLISSAFEERRGNFFCLLIDKKEAAGMLMSLRDP